MNNTLQEFLYISYALNKLSMVRNVYELISLFFGYWLLVIGFGYSVYSYGYLVSPELSGVRTNKPTN